MPNKSNAVKIWIRRANIRRIPFFEVVWTENGAVPLQGVFIDYPAIVMLQRVGVEVYDMDFIDAQIARNN